MIDFSDKETKEEIALQHHLLSSARKMLEEKKLCKYALTINQPFGEMDDLTEGEAEIYDRVRKRILRRGALRGEPDLVLRIPRHGYGALFIELKTEFGKVSEDQLRISKGLRELGNACAVVRSYDRAMELLRAYLDPECDFSTEGVEE